MSFRFVEARVALHLTSWRTFRPLCFGGFLLLTFNISKYGLLTVLLLMDEDGTLIATGRNTRKTTSNQ